MEISLGVINKPLIFVHQTSKEQYEVEIVQQQPINYEFDYLITSSNVEFFIGDKINSWVEPIQLTEFTFFDIQTSSTAGQPSFELFGFNVKIQLLNSNGEPPEVQKIDVFDFGAFLKQTSGKN